jgi:hypothetical protein
MAMKINEQDNRVYARRWNYCAEKKRSVPSTVFSCKRYSLPDELPSEVVAKHNVTKEEQQIYKDFVSKTKESDEKRGAKFSLITLKGSLERAKKALEDTELRGTLGLNEYEELHQAVNEIKLIISKNKNNLKKKQARQAKKKVS